MLAAEYVVAKILCDPIADASMPDADEWNFGVAIVSVCGRR